MGEIHSSDRQLLLPPGTQEAPRPQSLSRYPRLTLALPPDRGQGRSGGTEGDVQSGAGPEGRVYTYRESRHRRPSASRTSRSASAVGRLAWVTDSPELPWVPLPAAPTPAGVRRGAARCCPSCLGEPLRALPRKRTGLRRPHRGGKGEGGGSGSCGMAPGTGQAAAEAGSRVCCAVSAEREAPAPYVRLGGLGVSDVDLKAYQKALDNYFPHQGGDQLKLQDTNQSNHNHVDSLLSLEGCLHLLSSQMENMLEVNLLEDTEVATSGRGQEPSSSHYSVSLTQMLCHCFSPHEAPLLKTDHPTESHSETRHSQKQDCFPQSDSSVTTPESLLCGSHLTGLFPAADIGNLTAHDNSLDEIKLMSLEDGCDPIEVSQLFEESSLDLALVLNSGHSTASYSVSSEGAAIGYNSDANSASSHGLEAIGGHSQEHTKYDHVEYPGDSECSKKATLKQFLHKHTYHQLPSQAASTPVLHQQMWMKPSKEVKERCCNTTDKKLSSDAHHANSLTIPFSVDEIVSMPVDSFNTMLAKNQLPHTQVSLLRDIRRRGKNKVAAQNCRKRKLKAILNLEEAVCNLQTQKESLKREHSQCSRSISRLKQKLKGLHRDIFSHLRDDQGRPVNPYQYVIHCSSDGSVLLIPKYSVKAEQKQPNEKEQIPK
ncbi:nuclear factor erythroid 2-related factor 3 [Indicator indicator]|uniref:nuclear factor erythroid 2-related factor 3 n=1 Tax=Indicator indicator TaxID=1002788 RepID=UPI0023E03565|nr:nuclear factor erythroid 2-related factor 3 [Indicator indicator]